MFLKNRNISSKIKRSKVTDYAALTIEDNGEKIARTVLSPDWRQMAIKNFVSIDFLSTFIDSINVFDCHLPGVDVIYEIKIKKFLF